MVKIDMHRGWNISFDPKPHTNRNFDWTATHPNFDGPEDTRSSCAETREELIRQIDAIEEDAAGPRMANFRDQWGQYFKAPAGDYTVGQFTPTGAQCVSVDKP